MTAQNFIIKIPLLKTNYPKDYEGPISGLSTVEEWAAVRDWQAYKWITDGTWSYCDFDNYLYSMMAVARNNLIKE